MSAYYGELLPGTRYVVTFSARLGTRVICETFNGIGYFDLDDGKGQVPLFQFSAMHEAEVPSGFMAGVQYVSPDNILALRKAEDYDSRDYSYELSQLAAEPEYSPAERHGHKLPERINPSGHGLADDDIAFGNTGPA